LASIKVSELPAVTAVTPNDVLIINDENSTTSSITITNFTSSFINQSLAFTGNTSFSGTVSFLSGTTPVFNSDTVFSQRATFNGPISLGSLALIPIGSLSDVTVPATIPNGNVLTWDNTSGYWTSSVPVFTEVVQDVSPVLGGNLDVGGFSIVSASGSNVQIDPDGAGVLIATGNATRGSGQIKLNCELNSHGVTVKGPAHSAAASYTFILPVSMGSNAQVLTTNGTDQTSWVTLTAGSVGAATAAQGTKADSAMQVNGTNIIPAYADDASAANGGVVVGGFYRIGNAVQVRLT